MHLSSRAVFMVAALILIFFLVDGLGAQEVGQPFSNAGKSGLPVLTSVPRTMTYQGILKDGDGAPVPDSFFDVIFRIYDAESDGNQEWTETITNIATDGQGLFTVTFSNVDLAFDEDYWLEMEIGGEILSPRQKINMVGYAAKADTADYALTAAGWVDDGSTIRLDDDADNVGIGIATPSTKLDVMGNIHAYGGITSDLSLSSDGDITALNSISAALDMSAGRDIAAGGNVTAVGGISTSGINTYAFQMANGAVSGYVLTSDGSGNGTWQSSGSGGGGGWVDNVGSVVLETETDRVGIGTPSPSEKLEVDGNLRVVGKGIIGIGCVGTGNYAFVAGTDNEVLQQYGSVAGGMDNSVSTSGGFIGGGLYNCVSGSAICGTIAGGYADSVYGNYAAIGGGKNNKARGYCSAIAGGGGYYAIDSNSTIGDYSFIGAGLRNVVEGLGASIIAGYSNRSYGDESFIGTGERNYIDGEFSAICCGLRDTIIADYSYLFGIDSDLSHDSTFMVDMPHIRFGDETDGYEFPSDDGSAGQVLITDGNGQLSWSNNLTASRSDLQELYRIIEHQNAQILELRRQNSDLESRITALENIKRSK